MAENRGYNNRDFDKKFKVNRGEFNPNINVGEIYSGKVIKIVQSGAFVEIPESPKKDGFVHISQLSTDRVGKVEDIIQEGNIYKFKLIGFDFNRKPKLSYKAVDQKTGKDIENYKRN
jgi:polyribonucleotide nucleotidyltransferase